MSTFNENEVFLQLQKEKNICRLCFSKLNEKLTYYSIFESSIHQILQYCLWNQIMFIEDKSLPKLLCVNCYISLKNSCKFLDIIIRSQDVISKFMEQKEILESKKESRFENNANDEVSIIDYSEDSSVNEVNIRETKSKKLKNEKKNILLGKANPKILSQKRKTVNKVVRRTTKIKTCCQQEFKTNREYFAHVRSHGILRKNYECSECDKKYASYFELEVHLRKHSGARPFHCTICKKSFIDRRNLIKHEKIHSGNKAHQCQVCQKKFLHSFTLKTHERIHSGEKPFVCETCGKSFNTSTELKIHYRTHTKEKPYSCNGCEKSFSSKAALNTHMLVHTGEKKFSCTICSRKCRTSFDLKTHMRCHSNERPYICRFSNCDKKYKNSSQLNVHLRTHKGEKPHRCSVCFKQFGESNTLKRHMGIHEKNIAKIT